MADKPRHGMHDSPEHLAWRKLKDRCLNPKSQRYDRYGARGITVCDRWRDSFENFYADMGPRPSADHSIDRIDNDGPYAPENCRWATRDEQSRNRSACVYLEHDGRRMLIRDWATELGMNYRTLCLRLQAGWSAEKALTTPTESRTWRGKPGQKLAPLPPGVPTRADPVHHAGVTFHVWLGNGGWWFHVPGDRAATFAGGTRETAVGAAAARVGRVALENVPAAAGRVA